MCGITAYAGARPARDLLLAGLERLEYRGYDSAGIAMHGDGGAAAVRAVGPLSELRAAVDDGLEGTTGIGHTRWATHGRVTEANAHPHADADERVYVVLNGIVENYTELREELDGPFSSETDAEVVAHLLAREDGPLEHAVRRVNDRLQGHFSYVAMRAEEPGVLAGTRRETPLVVGVGEGEAFLASALPAFLDETREVVHLEDGEVVRVTPDEVSVLGPDGRPRERAPETVEWDAGTAERGGYDTFMLKEIHEQPDALASTLAGRALESGEVALPDLDAVVEDVRRVVVVACGTSLHAGVVARDAIEAWAGIPAIVEVASEWRGRPVIVGPGDLVVGITQSGETADTLAAMRLARERGARVLAVTNVLGSQATREADAVLDTRAGLEVGVAATKTFTAQVAALLLLALRLAGRREPGLVDELRVVPGLVADVIERCGPVVEALAERHAAAPYWLFIGRHAGVAVAMEGALKLKEVSYAAADAYPAGEMKHGPIALLEEGTPVVCVATTSPVLDKLVSNVQEVRARGAEVLAITTAGDGIVEPHADHVVEVPRTDALLQPLLATVPVQLLAYHVARARGLDVDRPRNLAKTVTVE
jgi:glucosamine--fructose-6-phosphate aminotransferase (isomerizing)